MSKEDVHATLERLIEKLIYQFITYRSSLKEGVPASLLKPYWERIVVTQSEIQIVGEELERSNTEKRKKPAFNQERSNRVYLARTPALYLFFISCSFCYPTRVVCLFAERFHS